MERLTYLFALFTLALAAPACTHASFLRAHGVGAPLARVAGAHPASQPDSRRDALHASPTGVLAVSAPMRGTARKFMTARAPLHALPSAAGAPPMPQVQTGGTRINTDGMAPGAGASGVAGAAGERQYVQLSAGRMAVYRKADGALQAGPVGTHALFEGAGLDACAAPHAQAGSVLYDQRARRWIVSHLARGAQCIAVSTTADAAGAYRRYALPVQGAGNGALRADDARMALWGDALYFTFSLFDGAQGGYRGPRVCALDRAALLHGRDAALHCADLGREFGPAVVAALEGDAEPPKGAPALIVALDFSDGGDGGRLLLWRWPVTGADSGVEAGAPLAVPVAPFRVACADAPQANCVDQPHPGGALTAPGDRLMPRAAFRDDALVLAHAVQLDDGRTGLRWYELRDPLGAAHVYQQGTHAPDRNHRAMGSIGIDKSGNIALGYSVAGRDTPPGVRYTGRQKTDPPGRMAGEEVVVNGHGVQTGEAPRWAASGALSLDPADDCTFWYTQQYLPATGPNAWRTRIASFKFGNCM